MKHITFSTDTGTPTREDKDASSALSESFFHTSENPDQLQIDEENKRFIMGHLTDYDTIIKEGSRVIGFTFCFPASYKDAQAFVDKKLSERALFDKVKSMHKPFTDEALYLCATVIAPEYRGRALSYFGFQRTFKKLGISRERTVLVAWPFSDEIRRGAELFVKRTGYQLWTREA